MAVDGICSHFFKIASSSFLSYKLVDLISITVCDTSLCWKHFHTYHFCFSWLIQSSDYKRFHISLNLNLFQMYPDCNAISFYWYLISFSPIVFSLIKIYLTPLCGDYFQWSSCATMWCSSISAQSDRRACDLISDITFTGFFTAIWRSN